MPMTSSWSTLRIYPYTNSSNQSDLSNSCTYAPAQIIVRINSTLCGASGYTCTQTVNDMSNFASSCVVSQSFNDGPFFDSQGVLDAANYFAYQSFADSSCTQPAIPDFDAIGSNMVALKADPNDCFSPSGGRTNDYTTISCSSSTVPTLTPTTTTANATSAPLPSNTITVYYNCAAGCNPAACSVAYVVPSQCMELPAGLSYRTDIKQYFSGSCVMAKSQDVPLKNANKTGDAGRIGGQGWEYHLIVNVVSKYY
ncbi:hypothetical protein HDU76_003711 [Blyttiomyces sp. JEL0837]|nr:hypothetical protein HDU76_003711 [Blyttiomyces sp. JEL0837]